MGDKELKEKYCDNCKNIKDGTVSWKCFECFYDMRFFKDKRILTINIPITKYKGTIETEGYKITYTLEKKGL